VSIYLVTGPPGTGKTWFSLRTMFEALQRGQWVASNVELQDGWAQTLARQNWLTAIFKGKRGLRAAAAGFEEHTYVSTSLTELLALRLPACKRCKACRHGRTCQKEGRGIIVLDEAHEWLNARTWDQDEHGAGLSKGEAIRMRLRIVKFFSHHRKLGWHVYLVTQDEKRLDNQVRNNFEYHVHLKNMRRYKALGLIPIVPCHLFVAITTWHATKGDRVGIKAYRLNKLADLYDTMASPTLRQGDDVDGLIHLPLTPDQIARRAAGESLHDVVGKRTEPQGAAAPDHAGHRTPDPARLGWWPGDEDGGPADHDNRSIGQITQDEADSIDAAECA
jgi:Zonular occludens toxin (Zot)